MFELNNLESIKIGLASPEKIREWSYGEVTKPETINYRTQKPEPDGLFCEKIFGPTKDWRCRCGKYKLIRYKGVICDRCGVEVTKSKVRRERMGHIELATPVSHIWFFRGLPSRIGTILDITAKNLEQVLYYVCYIVLDKGTTNLEHMQVLTDKEYKDACDQYGRDAFRVGMGAEAIKELLGKVDLEKEQKTLHEVIEKEKGQKKLKAAKRLEVIEAFIKSGNNPKWMIMDVIPVLPADLRPMVQLDGGRFATCDLNDLYRRVINRNNRLKKLIEIGAPEVIIRNEKRMLQEAVDALIENGKRGKAIQGPKQRDLKSLTAILRGKQGRFRQNLLGKRVDYSGRSVIVIGPTLKMYQCGLPKEMALELFKPFIMHELVKMNASHNIRSAKRMIDQGKTVVWDVLDKVIKEHPVLLNRAPTLHRLGIQAFEPVLVEGRAIKLHPLVCKGFHADFDGDQMPIHIPLSIEARAEARTIMLSTNNILKPSDGGSVVTPALDMVIGCYYLTLIKPGSLGEGSLFINEDEALMAYQTQNVSLQAKITVRRTGEFNGEQVSKRIETSVGRILFNRCVPQNLGYVDRTNKDTFLDYEFNKEIISKDLGKITEKTFNLLGSTETVKMLDNIKELGYTYSTLSGITINLYDIIESPERSEIIEQAEKEILAIEKQYRRGLITKEEKRDQNIATWTAYQMKFADITLKNLDTFNPVKMMAVSKARGNADTINQMAGLKGIIPNNSGQKVDVPVKSNYSRGLAPIEYFIGSRGGRKVLSDTALKTSESGYLTRKLVDVAQDVVVTEIDCFERLGEKVKGIVVKDIVNDGTILESLENRIVGRFTVEEVKHPQTGEIIVPANTMITIEKASEITAAGIKEVNIRSLFTCRCRHGVCAKCYGKNMVNNEIIPVGEAVGVIAAQAIGEPGTQLSMKNFAASFAAGNGDITQGLPRVVEIFDARVPKGMAYLSEVSGRVTVKEADRRAEVIVHSVDGDVSYLLPFGARLKVATGDVVEPGDPLNEGSLNPKDVLRTKGLRGVQDYLLTEVLAAYRSNSVSINAKHLEIIIRQMLKKVRIENAGDTNLIIDSLVDIDTYEDENQRVLMDGGVPAMARREVLGITKAALNTDSFLSAASFQQTSSVLTDAAVKGKVDHLMGLKENVIVGKLIPAGTGFSAYKDITPKIVKSTVNDTQDTTSNKIDDLSSDFDFDLSSINE